MGVVTFLLAIALALLPGLHAGAVSVYWPGAGAGEELACGGLYRTSSRHLALRGARRGLCGRAALVCSWTTLRCAVAPVLDAGPWGSVRGRGPRDGYMVHLGRRLPAGWRWRACADLSRSLWLELGRPGLRDGVIVVLLPWRRGEEDRT